MHLILKVKGIIRKYRSEKMDILSQRKLRIYTDTTFESKRMRANSGPFWLKTTTPGYFQGFPWLLQFSSYLIGSNMVCIFLIK